MSASNVASQLKALRELERRAADFGASITPINETGNPLAITHFVVTLVAEDADQVHRLFDFLSEKELQS